MPLIARRDFLKGAAAAGVAASMRANPLGLPIGSQTYPHRQRIKNGDFAGLCADMVKLGIASLELCSPGYAEFVSLADARQTRQVLKDHGLQCPSSHFSMSELRRDQQKMIDWAKEIGMTQMGTASLGAHAPNGVATMDTVKAAADEYNKIAETASKSGIQQFLHDEGFEVSHVEGRLTYEVLLELLDPKLVKMQFQMSAMKQVGDPVMYFNRYPGRFLSMHLQGVDTAPAQQPAGGARPAQPPVGKDSLDWPKIFAAAKTGGVRNYFVELNWDLTVQSVEYLKTLNV